MPHCFIRDPSPTVSPTCNYLPGPAILWLHRCLPQSYIPDRSLRALPGASQASLEENKVGMDDEKLARMASGMIQTLDADCDGALSMEEFAGVQQLYPDLALLQLDDIKPVLSPVHTPQKTPRTVSSMVSRTASTPLSPGPKLCRSFSMTDMQSSSSDASTPPGGQTPRAVPSKQVRMPSHNSPLPPRTWGPCRPEHQYLVVNRASALSDSTIPPAVHTGLTQSGLPPSSCAVQAVVSPPPASVGSVLGNWATLIRNNPQNVGCMIVFSLLVAACFYLTGHANCSFSGLSCALSNKPLHALFGPTLFIAKGSAGVTKFAFAVIIFPILRNTITFLRETWLRRLVPFDDAILWHKGIAMVGFVFSFAHTFAHVNNYIRLSDPSLEQDYKALVGADAVQPTLQQLWTTPTSLTGVIMCLILLVAYLFAAEWPRQASWLKNTAVGRVLNNFNNFAATHCLFVAFYALFMFHAFPRSYGYGDAWCWVAIPICAYLVEKLVKCVVRRRLEFEVSHSWVHSPPPPPPFSSCRRVGHVSEQRCLHRDKVAACPLRDASRPTANLWPSCCPRHLAAQLEAADRFTRRNSQSMFSSAHARFSMLG